MDGRRLGLGQNFAKFFSIFGRRSISQKLSRNLGVFQRAIRAATAACPPPPPSLLQRRDRRLL